MTGKLSTAEEFADGLTGTCDACHTDDWCDACLAKHAEIAALIRARDEATAARVRGETQASRVALVSVLEGLLAQYDRLYAETARLPQGPWIEARRVVKEQTR